MAVDREADRLEGGLCLEEHLVELASGVGLHGDRAACADLSIAIRTIVNSPRGMTIGAGGAITVQSDPHAELEEMLLKAKAPLEAVGLAIHGHRDAAVLQTPRAAVGNGAAGRRRAAPR